jgi:hypothetical protein
MAALKQSHYTELHNILCEVDGTALTLTGSVPTYFHKQLAQAALIREVAGAVRIRNELKVCASSTSCE